MLDPAATLEALRPILGDPAIEKVGQNIKYDMLALERAGVELAGPVTDTMILSYLLESGERNHNLDQLSQRLLDHTMIPITDLIGKGKNQGRMDQVAVDRVAEYAGEDADATWRIEAILAAKVRDEGLWDLYAELERPLIAVLARMEAAGVEVDVARLQQLSREFAERIATIETEIYALAGRTFNINSGPQLRQVLFDELKLPSLQKTPGGEQSTAQEVLEELALEAPVSRPALAASPARQAQEHLPRRAPGAGASRGRPDSRLVQPERRGDRPAELERPQPPEHPGAHRGRPPDPPGVHRGPAGLAAA